MRPRWRELYGSGLRASALLASHCDVRFATCASSDCIDDLRYAAELFGITVEPHASSFPVRFEYVHPLSIPIIRPRPDVLPSVDLRVSAKTALCFGMLDAQWSVSADTVVYDPQRPVPQGFLATGSSSKRLAIVANARELRAWSGCDDVLEGARAVGTHESAEVVVVKRGLNGVSVITGDKERRLPAYESQGAWSIGSGDVFSAAFTWKWALEGEDACTSADFASQVVAAYAETRSPTLNITEGARNPAQLHKGAVYLAAPFFSLAERWLVEETRAHLKDIGLDVLSPLHDVRSSEPLQFAPLDIEMLAQSTRVFAILDGFDPGTLFELGYAHRLGIPIVAFTNRHQDLKDERLNMLRGLGVELHDDYAYAIWRSAQVCR